MSNFRSGEGGSWLVTQTLGYEHEVINSCTSYEDAEERAENLISQSPNRGVTIYKAVERFTTEQAPTIRRKSVV